MPLKSRRVFLLSIILMLFGTSSPGGAQEIQKMRIIIQPLASQLPLNDINLVIGQIEDELNRRSDYFQQLDRSNIDALFDEAAKTYDDWMSTYSSTSEVRNVISGLAADHMLFAEIGRSTTAQEYYLKVTVSDIASLEKKFTRTKTESDFGRLRSEKISEMIGEIVDAFFKSRVSLNAGLNAVKCSIQPKEEGRGFRDEVTVNGSTEIQIPYGSYVFTFRKEDYRRHVIESVVNSPTTVINWDPQPLQGTIFLDGTPESPNIYIDGDLVENSRFPFTAQYPIGKHVIHVKKLGFYDWTSDRFRLEDQQVYSKVIHLQRPPLTKAMRRTAVWPGWGHGHLGYQRKAMLYGGAQVLAVVVAIGAQKAYSSSEAEYEQLKAAYESMETGDFNAARKAAESEYKRRNFFNGTRITAGTAAAGIWIVAGVDTWLVAQRGDKRNSNVELGVVSDGVTLSVSFR